MKDRIRKKRYTVLSFECGLYTIEAYSVEEAEERAKNYLNVEDHDIAVVQSYVKHTMIE